MVSIDDGIQIEINLDKNLQYIRSILLNHRIV